MPLLLLVMRLPLDLLAQNGVRWRERIYIVRQSTLGHWGAKIEKRKKKRVGGNWELVRWGHMGWRLGEQGVLWGSKKMEEEMSI